AQGESLRPDPRPERVPLHPERAPGHRDGRRRGRHRRRVRRLATRTRLRHHHDPGQHEHSGSLRGAGVDLGRGPGRLRRRGAGGAVDRALGRDHGMKGETYMHRFLSAVALVVVWPRVFALPAGAQTPEKVVFALNWFAVGDHAAYWVALDKGY